MLQDRAATLVQQLDTGEILVKVDNGQEEIVDARPRTVVGASHIQRLPGRARATKVESFSGPSVSP